MFSWTSRLFLLVLVCFAIAPDALGQSRRQRPRTTPPAQKAPQPKTEETTPPSEPADTQDVETLKIDTDLVTVPVIATDLQGLYNANLTKADFTLLEDGQKQEIAFFATISAPFTVVLLLDTSASTQEKLGEIRRAAIAFTEQLQPHDKVKVISFNDWITDHNEFTSDRALLRSAINKLTAGQGTKFYDAFSTALDSLRSVQGRKAIVLFSDGVDRISDRATYESSLRGLDEEGVIVYPIRYDTRAETERLVRKQLEGGENLPTIDVIRDTSTGQTPPTFPSEEEDTRPQTSTKRTGPLGLPTAREILRQTREEEARRESQRFPRPGERPPDTTTTTPPVRRDREVVIERGGTGSPDPGTGETTGRTRRQRDDSVSSMLDLAYFTADGYLKELERRSGGRLLRADTLGSLPEAFAQIAAELRTQYALSYYPTNKKRDGKYRTVKVSTERKDVRLRARPGYSR